MTVIEVFADVRCPFAHVGLRRVVERRRELGADFALHVRAWPLELVNGEPLDAEHVAGSVRALQDQVVPDLFSGFDPRRFPATSLPALELAAAAYDVDVRTGERASLAIRDALFEEGRDIADHRELERIAVAVGVPGAWATDDRVQADWREGQQRGVVGSPHFFVGDSDFFCPSLDIRRQDGDLRVQLDEGFDSFLDHCVRAARR
jgi:predicted DsbA family dithiol-disulfide isomerase